MVIIVGKGVWGHALSSLLEENSIDYVFWDRQPDIDPESIVALAVPAQAIREVLTANPNLKNSVIVNTSKGIEKDTHMLPFQIAHEVLGSKIRYLALFGPSFAGEVEQKMPTLVNLSSMDDDLELAQEIKDIFETDQFRVRITSSAEAIELAGALKNIYAISSGISEGLGYATNTKSLLIGQAYRETVELCSAMGFEAAKDSVEGIMGDLVLTCSGSESRNFRFGKYLTKMSVENALNEVASTVEGRGNSYSVPYFIEKSGLNLPLAKFIYETIENDSPEKVKQGFKNLMKSV